MNKWLKSGIIIAAAVYLAGCTAVEPSIQTYTLQRGAEFNREKLTYVAARRAYLYEGKALYDLAGKKVASQEQAEELLSLMKEVKYFTSRGDAVASISKMAYVVPVGLACGLAVLPVSPIDEVQASIESKNSFELVSRGEKLLERKMYKESRQTLMTALFHFRALGRSSHLYYDLALSYEGEGNAELANYHYRLFLEQAIDLYPRNYPQYDASYANDLERLDREFSQAEERLGLKKK